MIIQDTESVDIHTCARTTFVRRLKGGRRACCCIRDLPGDGAHPARGGDVGEPRICGGGPEIYHELEPAGPRCDPAVARICYGMVLELFTRTLNTARGAFCPVHLLCDSDLR